MKRKALIILLLFIAVFTLSPEKAFAAKKRVWKKTGGTTAATKPGAALRLSSDRHNLIMTLSNLQLSEGATYELTYLSGDLEQGVFGSVSPSEGKTATKTLYFGTCSKNVCTAHTNITGTKMQITFKLKTGQNLIKRYKIKV